MKIWFKNHYRRVKIRSTVMIRLVEKVLGEMGEPSAEVGLVLTGDPEIRRLNWQYRGIDRPTDVLAFPMREKRESSYYLLGDVVISIPTARKQALQQGHSLQQELALLIIHGLLHLLGYDHERSVADARVMKRKEKKLLKAIFGSQC